MNRRLAVRVGSNAFAGLVCLSILFPLAWMAMAGFKGRNEVLRTPFQFYATRFLLGVAEAGFFPGLIVYFTHWFTGRERARALSVMITAVPFGLALGAPLSGLILHVNWLGLEGWRWVFILEGAPAVIGGIVTIFYLTDWPHQATWLPPAECDWITRELEREKQAVHSYRIWEALRNRQLVLLVVAYFFAVTSSYGFVFWLPTIVKRASGVSNLTVTLITALPD